MGGHLDVHLSSVLLVVGQHLGGVVGASDVLDFGFPGVYCPVELVDASVGFGEALVGDGAALLDRRDEAMGDGSGCVGEVVVLHAEEGRS